MRRIILVTGGILSLSIAIFATGCGNSNSKDTARNTGTKTERPGTGAADSSSDKPADVSTPDQEITKVMAELSAEDRAIALQQKVCPVSGEKLGKMGAPLKMEVKGQAVFLCCEGCKGKLLASPDEYLAKINREQ